MAITTAIVIAAVLATFGWLYTNRTNQLTNRRQHTFLVFHDFRLKDDLVRRIERVADLVANKDLPNPYDKNRRDDVREIDKLLNHYEFVCAAVFNGDMDEAFVRSCEYTMITIIPKELSKYINESKARQATVFDNIISLADRWENCPPSKGQKFCEFFLFPLCLSLYVCVCRFVLISSSLFLPLFVLIS